MSEEIQKPKVGMGIIVFKDNKILLGKRKGSHGSDTYAFPGGHMNYGESFEECIKRETLEEAGIKIKNLKFLCVANVGRYENHQVILICFIADLENGEPQSFPDESIGEWQWRDLNNLPSPLFYPTELLIESYKTGKNYYDKE